MRKKIYSIIEPHEKSTVLSNIYDYMMILTIVISLVPLAFKGTNITFLLMDYITGCIFVVDYVLRLITADFKLNKSTASFFIYPFTPMAVIDLVSILPLFRVLHGGFSILKLFRLVRAIKVLKVFKFLRYSKTFIVISNVLRKQQKVLSAVAAMAVLYILISALVVYNVEPDTFETFFDAVYWATISLTTVGYGDIYPVTAAGRIVTMLSSVFGVAIIALPSGVVTAGYLDEINKKEDENISD